MRPSWLIMFLLLLSILIHHAQGIRLISKGSVASDRLLSLQEKHGEMRSNGGDIDNDGYKSKKWSGKRKRKLSRVRKEPHHLLPRIHEDYYGPRMHRPKHH
ncbi:hypothetical protein C2S52_010537 [Perilla frutescens var. hirtella]|nr:hypothetical protein C2S52_010537 [Perilla frutescens var. hirtella]